MKILKHGDKALRKFTCKFCGCVFVADRNEYITTDSNYFHATCPDCKAGLCMNAPLYKEE